MGTGPAEALARLEGAAEDERLEHLCRRLGVTLLTVFGSAGRRERDARDLDVAVAFAGKQRDVIGLLDALSGFTGSDDIDLLDLDRAGPVARERALVDCVALYEAEPGLWARFRTQAIMERMETDWLRRLDLELLAR